MKPSRIVALVIGSVLALPGLAMLLGGTAIGAAYAFGRDDDGYFEVSLERLESPTAAIIAEDIDLNADPGSPDWIFDAIDLDVRLRVTPASTEQAIFVGIGPEDDVDAYLTGVAHDVVTDFDGRRPEYRRRTGGEQAPPPGEQDFWSETASGSGTQELTWEATSGQWSVVVMNGDGSAGVSADADVGAKAGFVLPLVVILLVVGALFMVAALVLIIFGALGMRPEPPEGEEEAALRPEPAPAEPAPIRPSPATLTARLDPDLSRWQWLVKWFLAIPHAIVLFFLWLAFVLLTFVAGVAILFTGRYPRGIFDFNVGVLRWTWRVTYYAATGGLGTDRYPPFSLGPDPDYPLSVDIEPPGQLSRGLVLVKWWLLAIPHYLVLALIAGGAVGWATDDQWWIDLTPGGGGLVGLLVFIAAVILLFTGRYPPRLFDLIIGLNRWVLRVVAYAALMTDEYPPFRLDQGGTEPGSPDQPDGTSGPATAAAPEISPESVR